MPLVVPGVTTQSDDKLEEWSNKLVGKKITDDETSNEVVSGATTHIARIHTWINTDQTTATVLREA